MSLVCPWSPGVGRVMRSSAFNPFIATEAVSFLSAQTCADLSLTAGAPTHMRSILYLSNHVLKLKVLRMLGVTGNDLLSTSTL